MKDPRGGAPDHFGLRQSIRDFLADGRSFASDDPAEVRSTIICIALDLTDYQIQTSGDFCDQFTQALLERSVVEAGLSEQECSSLIRTCFAYVRQEWEAGRWKCFNWIVPDALRYLLRPGGYKRRPARQWARLAKSAELEALLDAQWNDEDGQAGEEGGDE
ncbi:MAG: hypothetical protein ACXWN0_10570 [Isosphaeraceae bacterium]